MDLCGFVVLGNFMRLSLSELVFVLIFGLVYFLSTFVSSRVSAYQRQSVRFVHP